MALITRVMGLGMLFLAAPVLWADEAEETKSDTEAIVALSELGAQMQLNQGRVVGLTLQGQEVDDETMKRLADLDRLQSLTLRDTNVTGEGLTQLQDLTLLGVLSIHDTPISDRDIDELASLKSVVNYDLRGTKVSGMGKQRLETLLERAKRESTVRLHFGGFLGVAGTYDDERCTVTSVVADSAAQQAGLEVGDVIVKFDGQPIENFSALAQAVAWTAPEQAVEVTIERGGQTMTLKVSLHRAPSP